MKTKKISTILLIALLVLAVGGLVLGLFASVATPKMAAQIRTEVITDIQNENNTPEVAAVNELAEKLEISLSEAVEMFANEMAKETLNDRATVVFIYSILVVLVTLVTLVISMIGKEYTKAMLSVGVMEAFFAIIFALEPMRFSVFFNIDFWLLIVMVAIAFIFIAMDVIIRWIIDGEFRKRMMRLVIVLVIDIVLATLFYFIFGDARAEYVSGMLAKYSLGMGWYAIISIFCYAAYVIVIGALLTILFASSLKKSKK